MQVPGHPMSQLLLDLEPAVLPSFDNFVVGVNAEVVAALQRLVSGAVDAGERFLYVWGERGSGRSHLLAAAGDAAGVSDDVLSSACFVDGARADATLIRAAVDAALLMTDGTTDQSLADGSGRTAVAAPRLVIVDDVHELDASAQEALFHAINRLREDPRGALIVAGDAAPRDLALAAGREDLRSRLAWGLVYRLSSLDDEAKDAALVSHAARRGFPLSSDVRRYLLTHCARDLGSLMRTVVALDRHAREHQRLVTVPLIRECMKDDAMCDPSRPTRPAVDADLSRAA